jgi:hypothetical protein
VVLQFRPEKGLTPRREILFEVWPFEVAQWIK